ncbi:MAG: CHASE2 domain-containing protein [Leptolyngbyaceae cyanobacterium bins.302]|nr:CHASE2 domain-containing protein [Leptolyngbyaceae cyanobacterium bins.302]
MTTNFWRNTRQRTRLLREIVLPGAIILSLVVILRLSGILQVQEWMAFDSLSHFCPSRRETSPVVVVGIDEADLQLLGGYPVRDRDLAAALTLLHSYRPTVIGLDLFRDVLIEPGHAALVQAFQSIPNLVGTEVALNSEPALNVKPPPNLPPDRIGFADVIVDGDGKLRRAILASPTWEGEVKYSFPLRLAQMHLATRGVPFQHGDRASDPLRFGNTVLPRFQPNSGGYIQADANGNQFILNFCSSQGMIRVLSLRDVLQKKVPADLIRDHVVIIGMTASSIKDIFFTSALRETLSSRLFSTPMPTNQLIYGVEAHAYTVGQIIDVVLQGVPPI